MRRSSLGEADDSTGASSGLRALHDAELAAEGQLDRDLLRSKLFPGVVAPPKLGQRYVLEGRLGNGGMGVVYAARDEMLGRRLAIKVLRPELSGHAQGRERLLQEARALAELAHPNVVALYDAGEWGDSVYIAMELLEGLSLADWLKRERRSCRSMIEVFLQAAAGLAAAHEQGVVHRDFKPQNVWVDRTGRVRVLDFGLARRRDDATIPSEADQAHAAESGTTVLGASQGALWTHPNQVVGTPAYMSPEQLHGFEVNERSDQYSFCVALFEATQGYHPNLSPASPGRPRDAVGRALLPVLRRGLSATPADRFASMSTMARALEGVLARRARWVRRVLLGGAVALALTASVAGYRNRELSAAIEDSAAHARDRARISAATRPDCDATSAIALLGEVEDPERLDGFRSAAWQALRQPYARSVVAPGEGFGIVRATALAASGACAAVSSADATLLWRRSHPDAAEHLAFGATYLRLSDDCRWVAARVDAQGWRIQRVDVVSHAGRAAPEPLELPAGDVNISPDGRRLALTHDLTFEILELPHGHRDARWERPRGAPWVSSWTRDGGQYLGFLPGGALLRWSLPGASGPGTPEELCDAQRWGGLRRVEQSRDGRWLAAGFDDGGVRLWPAAGHCREAREVLRHERRITALSFDGTGRWLASGGLDDTVKVWSLEAQTLLTLRGHGEGIGGLAFTPDGRTLVSASDDATARAWSLETAREPQLLRGHQRAVSRVAADGDDVVTVAADGSIRHWQLPETNPRVWQLHTAPIWSASLDASRHELATSSDDTTVALMDLESGTRRTLRGHEGPVREIAFSPAGERLVSASNDGSARVWDVVTGTEWARLEGKGPLYAAAYSPTGRHVAVGGFERKAWLWDLETGQSVELTHDALRIVAVQFDPSGERLYTCDGVFTAIWDVATGKRSGRLEGHAGLTYETRFDPAGGRVFTASEDGTVRAFGMPDRRLLGVLGVHQNRTGAAVFSRDGALLVIPSLDATLSVWDARSLALRTTLRRHESSVAAADFDASGQRVVSASHDGTARLWWLDAPAESLVLRSHVGAVRFAAFDAWDRVVSAGVDGTVRVWQVPLALDVEQLRQSVLAASTHCLSAVERVDWLAENRPNADARARACRDSKR